MYLNLAKNIRRRDADEMSEQNRLNKLASDGDGFDAY